MIVNITPSRLARLFTFPAFYFSLLLIAILAAAIVAVIEFGKVIYELAFDFHGIWESFWMDI